MTNHMVGLFLQFNCNDERNIWLLDQILNSERCLIKLYLLFLQLCKLNYFYGTKDHMHVSSQFTRNECLTNNLMERSSYVLLAIYA